MCKTFISGYAHIKMINEGKLELQAAFLLPDDTLFHAHPCFPGNHQAFHMMRAMSDTISEWNSVPIHAYVEGTIFSRRATTRDSCEQVFVDLMKISTVTQRSDVLLQDIEAQSFTTDAVVLNQAA